MAARTPHLTSFHCFNRFPKEIRDAIWEFAARDDRPGVHFFAAHYDPKLTTNPEAYRIFGFNPDPSNVNDEENICHPHFYYNGFKPANSVHLNYNPSTYLIDSGMWTACHESRDVLLRLSRKRLQRCPEIREVDLIPKTEPGPFAQEFRQNCVGYFYSTDTQAGPREKQYFTVLSHDLLCVQMPKLFPYPGDIPFVHPGYVEDYNKPRPLIEHVAFEYNPYWNVPLHEVFKALEDSTHSRRPPSPPPPPL